MIFFSIAITVNKFENNFFTGTNDPGSSLVYSRQIRFEGKPVYDFIGADFCHLKENGKTLEMPSFVSVYIRDNSDDELCRVCKYFPSVVENDDDVMNSNFEICVDYDQTEFEIIWDMFSKHEKCAFKFRASMKVQEAELPGMGAIIDVSEIKEWQLSSCSLDRIVNL